MDGNTVHYTDEGEGPTLLFVHAGMWSFVWRDVIARLREDFRCLSLDFPGQGLSAAKPGYPPTVVAHTSILASTVEQLGLEDVTLVAHDLGGPVAFGWAADHPAAVHGLVAVNTFGWPPHTRAFRGMLALMGSRPMRSFDSGTNLLFRLTSTKFGVGRHLDAESRRAFLGPFTSKGPGRSFHDGIRDVQRATDRLSELEPAFRTTLKDVPLLTIFGERNDPLGFQPLWKALFPDARQVVVPKGMHFPMCDDPDLFADSVRGWYREVVQGSGSEGPPQGGLQKGTTEPEA